MATKAAQNDFLTKREKVVEKEKVLLLNRHNKISKTKLKEANVQISDEIVDILCQTSKRTDEQKQQLEVFRQNAVDLLLQHSKQILKERQEKARRTREANLEKNPDYQKHFGIWINTTKTEPKITREHYAIIDPLSTTVSYWQAIRLLERNPEAPYILDHEEGTVYFTPELCLKHQRNCLINFDMNMQEFALLDHEDFEAKLQRFVKGRKFQEIQSFDDPICRQDIGYEPKLQGYMYIMVLDEYKQVYIGMTKKPLATRINQHWTRKRPFDRLIYGDIKNSRISIDSFGPLDTTRIFVRPYSYQMKTPLDRYETICIRAYDQRYVLNRMK